MNDDWHERMRNLAKEYIAETGNLWEDEAWIYSSSGNEFLHEAEAAYFREMPAVLDAPPPPEAPSQGFHLYRLWAEDGRLLYVGVSTCLRDRLRSHRRRWGDLIAGVTWEAHSDARSMLEAEREAIVNEDPAFNKAGVR